MGLLLIALGILCYVVRINRPKKNPCYVGQIVDISARPLSSAKSSTSHPIIVRVMINNQPIITSTSTYINCFWGINGILESKKKEHVGKTVHVYFNHQTPSRSTIKEFQGKDIAAVIILIVIGVITMFIELILILAFLYLILSKT